MDRETGKGGLDTGGDGTGQRGEKRRRGEAVSQVVGLTGEKEIYFNGMGYVNGDKVTALKSSPPSLGFQLFAKSSSVSTQLSGIRPSSYPGQENPGLPTARLLPKEMDGFALQGKRYPTWKAQLESN